MQRQIHRRGGAPQVHVALRSKSLGVLAVGEQIAGVEAGDVAVVVEGVVDRRDEEREDADEGGERHGTLEDLGDRRREVKFVDDAVDLVADDVEEGNGDQEEREKNATENEKLEFEGVDKVHFFF